MKAKTHDYIIDACLISVLLLISTRAYLIMQGNNKLVIPYAAAAGITALISLLCMRHLTTRHLIRISVPLYILVIIACIFLKQNTYPYDAVSIFGMEGRLFPLLGLVYFAGAYLLSKYSSYKTRHMILPAAVLGFLPCFVSFFLLRAVVPAFELFISLVLYVLLLTADSRRFQGVNRSPIRFYFIFMIILLFATPVWLRFSPHDRAAALLQEYAERRAILKSARMIGQADLLIDGVPAYSNFVQGLFYGNSMAFVLRYGWLPFGLSVIASSYLSWLLYAQTKTAANSYASSFSLAVCSLFTVRTLLTLAGGLSLIPDDFTLPLNGDIIGLIIDIILIISAVVLCDKEETAEDLLERQRPVNRMLDAILEAENSRLHELEKLFSEIILDDVDEEWDEEYEEKILVQTPKETLMNISAASTGSYDSSSAANKEWEDMRQEITALKARIREIENDRAALLQQSQSFHQIIDKYAPEMADVIVPETFDRTLVFISYNHNDEEIAEYLAEQIEQLGLTAWYYSREIVSGSYPHQIMRALKQTAVFVVILSRYSNYSQEVFLETYAASRMVSQGIEIMPLLIDQITLSEGLEQRIGPYTMTTILERPMNVPLYQFVQKVALTHQKIMKDFNEQTDCRLSKTAYSADTHSDANTVNT